MNRTTVMLPESLKIKAMRMATKRGISLGELIREGLNQICASNNSDERDMLFADQCIYSGRASEDLAKNHDDYLYS